MNKARDVYDHFATLIDTGKMVPGEKLPTHREICRIWNISHATVVKAVAALRNDLYVVTSTGGTFVHLGQHHRVYAKLAEVMNQLDAMGQKIQVQEFAGLACLEGKDSGVCWNPATKRWEAPTPY